MTPRINESNFTDDLSSFSTELFYQLNRVKPVYRLDGEGEIFEFWHPALIKCRHRFNTSPQDMDFRTNFSGWNIIAFKNQSEAIKIYDGFPWHISHLLRESPQEAFIHFGILGSIHLSQTCPPATSLPTPDLNHHMLSIWLDYALSPELWGPAGKWTRFHERLHTLFDTYGLLVDDDFPGYYPLKKESQWLSKFGFQGKITLTSFDLIMTWDFPLSGLIELEKVLARGP